MRGAELFARCLENESVEYIFGIPGEENIDLMDALLDHDMEFVLTRHEQGAAFMADVYGRLTGHAGVCLATLGPGATNLMTGLADASMDSSPVVAIAGQADTKRMHKESHQYLDLVRVFEPIAKYAVQVRSPTTIPEIVRKSFKVAETERPGLSFIEFPEDIAAGSVEGGGALKVQSATAPEAAPGKIEQAAAVISQAREPILIAGNGVLRAGASEQLVACAEALNIPVATTFMAKGAMPFSHPLSLGSVGMQAHDYVGGGFDRADVILCVGYDMVEYAPRLWHATKDRMIVHVHAAPAEVDEYYPLEVGVVGDIAHSLSTLAELAEPRESTPVTKLREIIRTQLELCAEDTAFPLKPQKIVWDLRQALSATDIAVCDVGAHKMWMARMFETEAPNTCLISNGFASMGIALPGAIAAKLVHPDRKVIAVCGDAGFLMNCQELETAMRLRTPLVVLIWRDDKYGLIEWHQNKKFGRTSHIAFTNPDFVRFAESFGATGYRIECAADLAPTLRRALADDTVSVIDCPVDYGENMKLTRELGHLQLRS